MITTDTFTITLAPYGSAVTEISENVLRCSPTQLESLITTSASLGDVMTINGVQVQAKAHDLSVRTWKNGSVSYPVRNKVGNRTHPAFVKQGQNVSITIVRTSN